MSAAALFKRVVSCAGLAIGVAGCTASSSSTGTVAGKTLTIYASVPSQSSNPTQAQDILAAEQLALQQGGAQVGSFRIRFVRLDGSKKSAITDNARTAIVDSTTIAYLGEIDPGASAQSIPITNDQDVLQVSPTDTALQYTESTPAVPGAPGIYYAQGSYRTTHTFARVVPSAALEAKAQIAEMKLLHRSKLYVGDDGTDYGKAIALAVAQDASSAGISVKPGPATAAAVSSFGADAVFMGASDGVAAASLFNAVGSTVKLFAPSALDTATFASRLNPTAAPNLYVSSPGFTSKKLPPAGQKFVSDFTTAYGHAPALEAIFGYEAMASVLGVLHQAGSLANSRATVISDFYAIKNRTSVLGTYSIHSGDPTLGPFVFSHVKAGQLVPFTFTEVQG